MARALRFVCYDDAQARRFEPFALSRPWSEMRVGTLLQRERWSLALGGGQRAWASAFLAGPEMRHFREMESPRSATGLLRAGTWVVNSRCSVALDALEATNAGGDRALLDDAGHDAVLLRCENRVAAVKLSVDVAAADFADGTLTLEALARAHYPRRKGLVIQGDWCDAVWDVIRLLSSLLKADIPVLARALNASVIHASAGNTGAATTADVTTSPHAAVILGHHGLWCEGEVHIEPYTVFDTRAGPVLLRDGVSVGAFTRVAGPCYVGPSSTLVSGRIGGSAIGDACKVNGEMSATVLVGHSNKGHDGFIGHSVLGRWVNLGAGTTTSNLKNTYGTVALWTGDGVRDTGLQFLGTLFGDHVKTGIGLRLTTGCVLGAGANVVDQMPPKVVAPFAWGSGAPYATYDVQKFMSTAARVMSRREITLDDVMQRHLRGVHARRWTAE